MTTIIYIQDYKVDEEESIRETAVKTVRLPTDTDCYPYAIRVVDKNSPVFVRGPRISSDQYERIWEACKSEELDLVTSPESFRIAGSFELHYPILHDFSPRAMILDASMDNNTILKNLTSGELKFPVFVRSEVESAAKYVGVDGCIIQSASLDNVSLVIKNLREHIPGFRTLILKEMFLITTVDGMPLEYRAIGARGRLIAFDYDIQHTKLPNPKDIGIESFVERAFYAMATGGATGAAFMDIAVVDGGTPVVVECKDFVNGSIAHPVKLAQALLNWQK